MWFERLASRARYFQRAYVRAVLQEHLDQYKDDVERYGNSEYCIPRIPKPTLSYWISVNAVTRRRLIIPFLHQQGVSL